MMNQIILQATKALAWICAIQTQQFTNFNLTNADHESPIPGDIPGESFLKYCNESSKSDIFSFDRLEVHPTPLVPDVDITVIAYGTFAKNITENAIINATLIQDDGYENGEWDFCGLTDGVEQPNPNRKVHCPPEKGFAILTYHAGIPSYIGLGMGHFYLKFDAKTAEGERIFCVDGSFFIDPEV